jgi:class 3 adenylate cyclase
MPIVVLEYLKIIIGYVKTAPAYLQAAWETALYFYEPKLAAMAAGVVLLLLVLRIVLGGIVGWLIRTLLYAGLFYVISTNEELRVLYPDPVVADIITAIAIVAVWLPVTILGGAVRLLRRGGRRTGAFASAGAPSLAATGEPGRAFDVARTDKDTKQVMVIMMTDIVGYSARMEKDEAAAYALLKEHNVIMRKAIGTHRGKEIKTIGDAFMVVFQSSIDALRCGIAMQTGLRELNRARPSHDQLKIRIGIHRGEVIRTEKDVFGEGVNIAARMESVTEPGGISICADIYNDVKGKVEAGFQSIGQPKMKNIANPPEVFRVHLTQ